MRWLPVSKGRSNGGTYCDRRIRIILGRSLDHDTVLAASGSGSLDDGTTALFFSATTRNCVVVADLAEDRLSDRVRSLR